MLHSLYLVSFLSSIPFFLLNLAVGVKYPHKYATGSKFGATLDEEKYAFYYSLKDVLSYDWHLFLRQMSIVTLMSMYKLITGSKMYLTSSFYVKLSCLGKLR